MVSWASLRYDLIRHWKSVLPLPFPVFNGLEHFYPYLFQYSVAGHQFYPCFFPVFSGRSSVLQLSFPVFNGWSSVLPLSFLVFSCQSQTLPLSFPVFSGWLSALPLSFPVFSGRSSVLPLSFPVFNGRSSGSGSLLYYDYILIGGFSDVHAFKPYQGCIKNLKFGVTKTPINFNENKDFFRAFSGCDGHLNNVRQFF